MSMLSRPPYRKWFLCGLVVQVIAAWFSTGYHHPDEHFQILEFCNYKLGFSSASDLPWEFSTKCRSAVLPFVAYALSKLFLFLHLFNPFIIAFLLRLMTGLLTWIISYSLINILSPEFKTEKGIKLYVLCSMLLWYVPYIGVRFSSENVAGILFFISIIILLKKINIPFEKNIQWLFLTGLFLGFAIFIRLQMAFALSGLSIWMLFIKKYKASEISVIIAGFLAASALCLWIDYWFYGTLTFTPFNYYKVNIVQNVAVNWGVFPWWYYVPMFLKSAVLPISAALFILFCRGVWLRPVHLFSIVCIFFIAGHSFIGHKEMRFLFPIGFAFLFLVSTGMDAVIYHYGNKQFILKIFKFLAVINVGLLLFKIFTPAQEAFDYYKFIYDFSQGKSTRLYVLKESPYHLNNVKVNFYKSKYVSIYNYQNIDSIVAALKNDKEKSLFFCTRILPASLVEAYQLKKVYCTFPDAILKYNINHWQDRSNIWAIYTAQ